MSQDDKNIPEISVGAEMTEKGFSASAKSRFIAACDRLFGNIFDLPNPSIEAFNSRRRARAEVREALIRRAGEKAIGKIEANDESIDLVVDRLVTEEIRKQDNRERVAQLAIEYLREDPPKDEDGFNEEEFIDWMNVFSRYAEDASSERLRQLWAKVLSGQIRNGRAFSFGTLRLLSELDPSIAESFQNILEYRLGKYGVVPPESLEGEEFHRWTGLEDAGFISSPFGAGVDCQANDGGLFFIKQNNYAAVGVATPGRKIRVDLKIFTRAGLEVASILPEADGLKVIEAVVAKDSFAQNFKELRIVKVVQMSDGQYAQLPHKVIKAASDE